MPGSKIGDRAAATVAHADSPNGPWTLLSHDVVGFGEKDEWDAGNSRSVSARLQRKIYLYYKGETGLFGKHGSLIRAKRVAISDHPLGPFIKSPLNPVINSGHETGLFPFKEGIAAIVSLDGPEEYCNTRQTG